MALRHYRVVSSEDDDSEEDHHSLPSTSRSAKKRRFSNQYDTKKDSAFTQSLSNRLSTDSANSSKQRRLKTSGAEGKEKRYGSNIRRGCQDNDREEDECRLKGFHGSVSRLNKAEKSIHSQRVQPYQNLKKKKGNKESSIGHKEDLNVGSKQYEKGSEEDFEWNQKVKKQLEEEFEPSELEDSYMTAKDNRIKAVDIAERFQLLEESLGPMTPKGQQSREANWIYDRAFGHMARPMHEEFKYIAELSRSDVVQEIEFLLTQLHDYKLEIPFIGMYRKEGCIRLLHKNRTESFLGTAANDKLNGYEALWQVFYWDKKWHLLQRQKWIHQEDYKKRANNGRCKTMGDLLNGLLNLLEEAESEQAVSDIDAKFSLLFPHEEVLSEGQYKRPRRQSYYSICCKSGLGDFAKHFGLSPGQLGENLQAVHKIHEVRDCSSSPEEIAMRYCTGQLGNPHSAMKGARHMVASEISSEPAIREYARKIFSEQAVMTTRPTQKGCISIDKFHEYGCLKWIREKPVSRFDNGEWLLIQRAEEEELLEVTVKLTKDTIDGVLMHDLQAQYLSVDSSRAAELWNEHRKEILKDSVWKMLLPSLEKETRMLLTSRAKAWVQQEYANELWKRVSVSPYPHSKLDSSETVADLAPRVLACCWGARNSATFVMLDSYGDIISTLQTGYLNLYGGSSEQTQRKMNDQQRLQRFIGEHQPDVVVLGARNLACRHLKDAILENVSRLENDNSCSLARRLNGIHVIYGDESLSSLFEKSLVSREQLPGQPDFIRRAVALGRHLQNPLAMVASLCTPQREIVALKLHFMQSFLSTDEIYDAVEQIMITVTNQVGVDVNLAASHEWLFAPLQFVSGLGPRKASSLRQSIQLAGWISSRKELMNCPISMKQNVFLNCSGFLRIRRVECMVLRHKEMNPLDDTRIHPEAYELACDLAIQVYSADQGHKQTDINEVLLERAIHHIRQHPDMLKDLNIMDFSQSVQGTVGEETVNDIQRELLHGFREFRAPYVEPTQDEEFTWLTGEDEKSLAKGRVVNATARKIYQNRVMCALESGIWGLLQRDDMTIEDGSDLSEVISEGTILTCRVVHIQKEKFLVELTCRENSPELENWQGIDNQDEPNSQNALPSDAVQHKARTEDARVNYFRPRMIVHPLFLNISRSDAVKSLLNKKLGEVIFHPSRRGPSCLSMTLKFYDDVYVHKDLLEDKKDTKDLSSFVQLGKSLKLGDKTFQNLEEVVTCYVDPLITNLKAMISFEMFRRGSDQEIKALLHQDTNLQSGSFVYCFSICHQYPGAINMSYLRDMAVHHENIDLHPEGYQVRQKIFNSINVLVNYCKSTFMAPVNVGSGALGGSGRSKLHGSCGKSQGHWNSHRRFDGGFKWNSRRDGGSNSWDNSKEDKCGQNQSFGRDSWFAKEGGQRGTLENESWKQNSIESQPENGWSPENGAVEGQAAKDTGWDCPTKMTATNGWESDDGKNPIKSQPEIGWSSENNAVEGQAEKDSGWDCLTEVTATNGWESSNGKPALNEPGNLWGKETDEPVNGDESRHEKGRHQNCWNSTATAENESKAAFKRVQYELKGDKSGQRKGGQHQFVGRGGRFGRNRGSHMWKGKSDGWDTTKDHSGIDRSIENNGPGFGRSDDGWDMQKDESGSWNTSKFQGESSLAFENDGTVHRRRHQAQDTAKYDSLGRDTRKSQSEDGRPFENDVIGPQAAENDGWDSPPQTAAVDDWGRSVSDKCSGFSTKDGGWGLSKDESCGGGTMKLQGEDSWLIEKDNAGVRRSQAWDAVEDENLGRNASKLQSETGWPLENDITKQPEAESNGWDFPSQMSAVDDWGHSKNKSPVCDLVKTWMNTTDKNAISAVSFRSEVSDAAPEKWRDPWISDTKVCNGFNPINRSTPGTFNRDHSQEKGGQYQSTGRYDGYRGRGRGRGQGRGRGRGWGMHRGGICKGDPMGYQPECSWSHGHRDNWPSRRGQGWNTLNNKTFGRDTVECQRDSGWGPHNKDDTDVQVAKDNGWDSPPEMTEGNGWDSVCKKNTVNDFTSTRSNATDCMQVETGKSCGWDSLSEQTGINRFPMKKKSDVYESGNPWIDTAKLQTKDSGWDSPPEMTEGNGWDTVSKKKVVDDFASISNNATNCTIAQTAERSGWDTPSELAEINRLSVNENNNVDESGNPSMDVVTLQTNDSGRNSPWEVTEVNGWDTSSKKNNTSGNICMDRKEVQMTDSGAVVCPPGITASSGRDLPKKGVLSDAPRNSWGNLSDAPELQTAMGLICECNSSKEYKVDGEIQVKTSEWNSLSEMGTVKGEGLRKENTADEYESTTDNQTNNSQAQVVDVTE